MTAKPSIYYVEALRKRRKALGLTRCELYAHPGDHAALKALAKKLDQARISPIIAAKPAPKSPETSELPAG